MQAAVTDGFSKHTAVLPSIVMPGTDPSRSALTLPETERSVILQLFWPCLGSITVYCELPIVCNLVHSRLSPLVLPLNAFLLLPCTLPP